MEDPTAKMAMGFAGQGMAVGQQYMEQNVRRHIFKGKEEGILLTLHLQSLTSSSMSPP